MKSLKFLLLAIFLGIISKSFASQPFVPDANNTSFRQEILSFVIQFLSNQNAQLSTDKLNNLDKKWSNHYQSTDWNIEITPYLNGQSFTTGKAHGSSLVDTLKKAALATHVDAKKINDYRFKIAFNYFPHQIYPFIQFHQQGLELLGDRTAVRKLDVADIAKQIQQSEHYLLGVMHPALHGFYKFYNAKNDTAESELRTIYTASSLYTLLKINEQSPDLQRLQLMQPIAQFLLYNQAKTGPAKGGFLYSINAKNLEKSDKYVVGTAAKTIFTLLELHKLYPNNKIYLQAAKEAGNFLLTKVEPNALVIAISHCDDKQCQFNKKQSLLYSGQVLSALSRLYKATREQRYYRGAAILADNFMQKIKKNGNLLGDDYRPANSISSSWVMMSLMDFAKINSAPKYQQAVAAIGQTILNRQLKNKEDAYDYGRFLDAMTASGNGWINEVFGVYYHFCVQTKQKNCAAYKEAMILTSRWLIQNTYNAENTYNIKNPEHAIGGFITNFSNASVRTDAVCHGLNSLIDLQNILGSTKTVLVDIPERPLAERLPLLRAGINNKE